LTARSPPVPPAFSLNDQLAPLAKVMSRKPIVSVASQVVRFS
jgi:hypothetical protein